MSTFLPQVIRGTIRELYYGKIEDGMFAFHFGRDTLNRRRVTAINFLTSYFDERAQSQRRAEEIVNRCWNTKAPFCLYLRNFGLGARARTCEEELPSPEDCRDFWTYCYSTQARDLTFVRVSDLNMRRLVYSSLKDDIPLITIKNPDDPIDSPMSELQVMFEDWHRIVTSLINAAHMIVLYLDQLTPGISEELTIIRHCERRRSTIIIWDKTPSVDSSFPSVETDPAQDDSNGGTVKDEIARFLSRVLPGRAKSGNKSGRSRDIELSMDDVLAEFECIVNLCGDTELSQVQHKHVVSIMRERLRHASDRKFSPGPPIPATPRPSEDEFAEKSSVIERLFLEAKEKRAKGEYFVAEGILYNALGVAFDIDFLRMRAPIFLQLGRIQLKDLNEPELAIYSYEHAVRLYERLSVREMLFTAFVELAFAYQGSRDVHKTWKAFEKAKCHRSPEPNAWEDFVLWDSEEQLARACDDSKRAAEAHDHALSSYQRYREEGGEPKTSRAQIIADTTQILRELSNHHAIGFLESERASASLKSYGDLRELMLKALRRSTERERLLEATQRTDEWWELDRFINMTRQNDGTRL